MKIKPIVCKFPEYDDGYDYETNEENERVFCHINGMEKESCICFQNYYSMYEYINCQKLDHKTTKNTLKIDKKHEKSKKKLYKIKIIYYNYK